MKSVMEHKFSKVPETNIPRSAFDRSHGYKTTFDSGYLIPFFVDEALPGDTFNVKATIFSRLATPIVPFMDNLHMDTFYFAVPLRLIWDDFQKFCGEQVDPGDSTDFTVPQIPSGSAGGWVAGGLEDYFGLPLGVEDLNVSSLWHRAYNLIWNEWFRDQNLQDSVVVDKDAGPDAVSDYPLLKRGKRHDYFTSCLPWPLKGDGVEIPIGGTAPIEYNDSPDAQATMLRSKTTGLIQGSTLLSALDIDAGGRLERISDSGELFWDPNGSLYADLSSATAATINSLRQAFQLQKLYERDARGGSRYTEIVKSHFGTVSPDARLQRPEFLGGKTSPVQINSVQQTSETNTTPQGTLAAFGTVQSTNEGFTKSFTEHCVIIGLVSVRADLTYQRGIPRMFSRSTRWDFYWPALAHIGEQSVLNKEIYAQGIAADEEVFGYQERWAEYRYYPSKITGIMRSTHATTMDVWHLAQKFTSLPTLSDTFIQESPPIDRVIAVVTEPEFIFDSYIQCRTVRPMPVYSVPGLIDHF